MRLKVAMVQNEEGPVILDSYDNDESDSALKCV